MSDKLRPHVALVGLMGAGKTVVGAALSLKAYELLLAEKIKVQVIDAYSIQPVDRKTLVNAGQRTNQRIITVEDHYVSGGLGDAVSEAVAEDSIAVERLAVREIPRSGRSDELLDRFGISSSNIVNAVRRQIGA